MRSMPLLVLALAAPALSGCISTAASIVKAPFQVAGQAVDWTTTSQDEADRNFGRKMRKKEAREGRERKAARDRCRRDPEDCGPYDGYRADRD